MEKALEIYICNIEKPLHSREFSSLLELIDADKKERILRFRRWEDAHLSLFADLLVRIAVGQRSNIRNRDIVFVNGAYGKPVISALPHFHFNVSHSGSWVVCAIDSNEVGIDIEKITDVDLSISRQFFSADEHKEISESADAMMRFFDYWTLKESYIKLIGKGLSEPLNAFTVSFLPDGRIGMRKSGVAHPDVHFRQYNVCAGYKMAVCCRHSVFPEKCILTTTQEIRRRLQ